MSKQVDERVVSMEFDNKRFESNVKTSMSTIDKLKKSLNFDSATKSFSELDKAVSNLSFENIASGIETLSRRFSTFGIVGMRVIENLTDSAMRLTNQLTNFITSGVVQGGIKRAMNLENAHFQLQGLLKDEEAVAAVMKNVNDSVDGTAYSLDSAAKVASQFAASGMRAGKEMFSALRGIAGVAAMTNSEYDDIGRIFTKVAGQGRLMGDQLLQLSSRGMNAAATLATYLGKTEAEIRDMTSKGEISFATFAAAMDDAFGEHAKKANETFTGAMSNVRAALARIGALFVSPLVEQNGAIVQLFNALREKINDIKASIGPIADFFVKSVTSMTNALTSFIKNLDVKKPLEKFASVFSSKWNIFEQKLENAGISVDSFKDKLVEVAKEHGISVDNLISQYGSLEKVISGGKISKSVIVETIKRFIDVEKEASKTTTDITDKLDRFNQVVSQVVRGDFGNGIERIQKLTEAGYEAATVQKLVNYIWERNGQTWSDCSLSAEELAKTITDLSDNELKSVGYTDSQVKKIRELAEEAEKAGTPINELFSSLDRPTTKDLVIDTFRNALQSIVATIKSVKTAWKETFSKSSSTLLYNIVDAIHKFSEKLIISEDRAEKLTRTFKGLFAALDIVRMILSGALSIVFKVLKAILGAFNIEVLDFTAAIGDAIVKIRDWIKEHSLLKSILDVFAQVLKTIAKSIKEVAVAIYEWGKNSETVQKVLRSLSSIVDRLRKNVNPWLTEAIKVVSKVLKSFVTNIRDTALAVYDWAKNNETIKKSLKTLSSVITRSKESLTSWFDGIKDADNIPKYILSGLINGLKSGVVLVAKIMVELGRTIISSICKVLGIHSPSTEFFDVGKNTVDGLVLGIKEGASNVWKVLKSFGLKCIEIIKNIDFRAVLGAVLVGGITVTVYKMSKAFEVFASSLGKLFGGIGSMFENVGKGVNNLLTSIGASFKAKAFETKSKAILNFAIAIGILAASIYALAQLDSGSMWEAVGVIAAMAAVISLMALAISKLNLKDSVKIGSFALALVGIGVSIRVLSSVMKSLSGMSDNEILRGAKALGVLAVFITALIFVTKRVGNDINNVGGMILKISIAMLLMVMAIKNIAKLDGNAILKGLTVIGSLTIFISALMAMFKKVGNGVGRVDRLGSMLLKIFASMMLLVLVMKTIANMDLTSIAKGLTVITLFSAIIVGLMAATRLAGNAGKIGTTILGISVAIAIMAVTLRHLASLDPGAIEKGIAAITAFGAIITGLIYAVKLAGKDFAKVGATMVLVSTAIAILAGIAVLLGFVDLKNLAKGIIAVGFLSAMMSAMIIATGKSKKCKENLIAMAFVIGLLAATVMALSFIDQEKVKTATTAMSSMMGAFALLVASTKFASGTKEARNALIAAVAVVIALAGIIVMLAAIKPQNALEISAALSLLLLSMSTSLAVLDNIGGISKDSLKALAIMGLVVGEIAVILGILSALNVEPSITTAAALSVLLLGMSSACLIVSDIESADAAIQGAVGLAAFVGIIAALLAALGKLSQIPGFDDLIRDGGETLALIGYAIGNFIGSIIGGYGAGISSGLPAIGKNLSDFMNNAADFFSGLRFVNPDMIKKVGILVASIIGLTVAEMISAIGDMATFGRGFIKMGLNLSLFIKTAKTFMDEVGSLPSTFANNVKNLADGVLAITAASVIDGISAFTGVGNIAAFGTRLVAYGKALGLFCEAVSEKVSLEDIRIATNAGRAISYMLAGIDDVSFFDLFPGGDKLSNFSKGLQHYGIAISSFSAAVSNGNLNAAAVRTASNVGKDLADMAKSVPDVEFFDRFPGASGLEKFSKGIGKYGKAISSFSAAVGNGNLNAAAIRTASNVGKDLSEMAKSVPDVGFLDRFPGASGLEKFSEGIIVYGWCISEFSNIIGSSSINAKAIRTASNVGKDLSEMAKSVPEVGFFDRFPLSSDLEKFSEGILVYGCCISEFSNIIGSSSINVSAVKTAANAGKALADMASSVPDLDFFERFPGASDLEKFSTGIIKYAVTVVELAKTLNEGKDKLNLETIETVVNFGNKISSAVKNYPEDGDISRVTNGLSEFGESIINFSEQINGKINVNEVTPIVDAAKTLASAASIMPDVVDLGKLTNGLDEYATAIVDFSKQIHEKLDVSTVTTATTIGKSIAEMFKEVSGENISNLDLKTFSSSLSGFGSAVVDFSNKVGTRINITDIEDAKTAATAIGSIITDLSSATYDEESINNVIGKLGEIAKAITKFVEDIGEITYSTSDNARLIADNINSIITNFSTSTYNEENIDNVINKLSDIAEAIIDFVSDLGELTSGASDSAKNVSDNISSIMSNFSTATYNEENIDSVIGKLSDIAEAITSFVSDVGEITSETSTNSVTVASNIKSIVESFSTATYNEENIDSVINKLADIAESITTFVGNIETVTPEASSNAKIVADNIKSILMSFSDTVVNEDRVLAIKTNLETITAAINDFCNGIITETPDLSGLISQIESLASIINNSTAFEDAGYDAMSSVVTGMQNSASDLVHNKTVAGIGTYIIANLAKSIKSDKKKKEVAEAFTTVIKFSLDEISGFYDSFEASGEMLGEGLVDGIKAMQQAVRDAGYDLGQEAVQGEKEGQQSNSPSKLTIQAGKWLGEGLIIGIRKMFNPVYNAGHDLGETATGTISSAISRLVDVMDSDIDMQPTIRPVLDLSDIESGARSINGMLSLNPAISAANRVESINSKMHRVGQNGMADDITSAIENLGRKMDNMSGDTYNINGVTYDDDSSIAEAVKTIVRAARVERRV